jgi:uncharacterized membrane protein
MAAASYNSLGFGSYGYAISNDGIVAGENNGNFFYWQPQSPDTLQFIGGNGASSGLGYGGQADISADGKRILGNFNNAATGQSELAIYDRLAGTWTTLGSLGGTSGVEASSGWGMSRNGKHVAGLGWVGTATNAHGITWSEATGVLTDLGTTTPGRASRANAISDDGSVVVGWQDSDIGRQAAVWVNGVQRLLSITNDFGVFPVGEASAVTPDGRYVTGAGYNAFNWIYDVQTSTLTSLGLLGDFDPFLSTGGTDITDDGKTIIGYQRQFGFGGVNQGYIWQEGVGLTDLTEYAIAAGVKLPTGRVLTLPLGISADGTQITGMDNNFEGFIITVPEPAALGLVMLAVPMLGRRRK